MGVLLRPPPRSPPESQLGFCRKFHKSIMSRTYVNLETEQIRTLLELLTEVSFARDLTTPEQYVHRTLLDALDRCLHGM